MARIYKTKFKEAEQIVDENTTQAPAVQATPAEVEQAQAPADAQLAEPAVGTDPVAEEAVLPEGTESVEQGVQVNPETVSVEMQIPTDQLAAAVAQATGDVQPAEIAPDALAEQPADEPLVAQEDTDVVGVEGEGAGVDGGVDNTQVAQEAAPITESTDVHSNPGYKVAKETEEKLNDLIDAGVKNTAEDLTRELKKGDSKIKESEEACPECGKNPCECEDKPLKEFLDVNTDIDANVGDSAIEAIKESEESEDEEDLKDAIKDSGKDDKVVEDKEESDDDEKLDFSKLDTPDDDSNLPGGFEDDDDLGEGGMDTSIFDDLDDEEAGLTDIMGRLDGILGDKQEAAQVADSLRASADVIDAISGNDTPDTPVSDEDNRVENDEDAYLLSSLLDDDEEPLDFDKISDFGYDDSVDTDEEDVFGDDDDLDEDFEEFEEEDDDEDLAESNVRIPVKFPEKRVSFRERVSSPESKKETIRESLSDGIIYPAGSGPEVPMKSPSEPLVRPNRENLVEAHERAVEARRRAINRFRESVKRENSNSSSKFREALRSSVRISRNESSNSNSWSNNQFIDKYQESQKLDFSKLFEDGFLG